MLLSRNEILAFDDSRKEQVYIPEWSTPDTPAYVYVKVMSGADREIYEVWAEEYSARRQGSTAPILHDLYAKVAVLLCVDDDNQPLFSLDDVPALSRKSYSALKRIFDVAWRLNLLGGDGQETAAKNSRAEAN